MRRGPKTISKDFSQVLFSSMSLDDGIDKQSCPGCRKNMDFHRRLPCILPCGHTICVTCKEERLEEVLQKDSGEFNIMQTAEFQRYERTIQTAIQCPECNKLQMIDPADLDRQQKTLRMFIKGHQKKVS